jgi:hypothetical protein
MSENKFACKHCNKEYSSKQSRSNHYYLYHNNELSQKSAFTSAKYQPPKNEDTYQCKYCTKKYKHIQSRWKHEQKCDKNKIGKIEEENKQIKQEVKELKTIVNKLSKTTGNNSTININNGNIVNNINSLGYENILSKLSEKDKIHLLTGFRHQEYPIIELVRKIYTNDDFKNERNTLLTNLQNKSCLIYKSDNNKFEATNKNQHINDIIKNRRDDIVSMYNEFTDTTKLKTKERKAIEDYLENIEGIDKKDKKLKAFYEKHKEEIIYIIYNCKEFMGTIRDHLSNIVDDDEDIETIEV